MGVVGWSPRIGMTSLLFHRERGDAWTEITMRKIHDVLRLSAAGMSKRQIAASLEHDSFRRNRIRSWRGSLRTRLG